MVCFIAENAEKVLWSIRMIGILKGMRENYRRGMACSVRSFQ